MRLVIARCQVGYAGRLTAHPLLVKSDGSVSVHSDDRGHRQANPGWRHWSPAMKRIGAALHRLSGGSITKGWAQ
ncbi:hypothetical protein [Amycolatopsis sulphurea]|uniref:hypothetical protein n=1 Tax=Amycolatopsis sulphurea TaxID=76022 RepID=UPI003C2CED25